MKKKQIVLILVALIAVTGSNVASHAEKVIQVTTNIDKENAVEKFSDVELNHWAALPIYQMTNEGYAKGYTDNSFKPENKVTRTEFAAMLINTLELPISTIKSTFSDVSSTYWGTNIIATAVEYNLISGTGNNMFGFKENMKRQDAVITAIRAIEEVSGEIVISKYTTPTDLKNVSGYALEYVTKGLSLGLLNVYSDGTIKPSDYISRGEVANIMVNMKEYIQKRQLESPTIAITTYGEWEEEPGGMTLEDKPLGDTRSIKETFIDKIYKYIPLTGTEEWLDWQPKTAGVLSNFDNYNLDDLRRLKLIAYEEKQGTYPGIDGVITLMRIKENIYLVESGIKAYIYETRTKTVEYIRLESETSS